MAAVESAVYNLLGVFHKYSAKEGDNLTLNRAELSILLSSELPCCYRISLKGKKTSNGMAIFIIFGQGTTGQKPGVQEFGSNGTILVKEGILGSTDDAMAMLDLDGDGEVDFTEFIEFITDITTELQDMYIHNVMKYKRIPKFGAQTQSEKAIVALIKVFYKYASKGGDPFSLETKELRQLLRKEMPTLHPCLEGNSHFKELLKNMESKNKGQVDFKEFMTLVANFAVAVEFSFLSTGEMDDDD